MMESNFIIDVTEEDFEYEVLTYSQNVPVLVDYWAPWCRPCKTLSPLLEGLAKEAHGSFRLAKVDVDANPNLALRYSVRSIPTVKAFSDGQVVGEFVGLQPVERIRDFLSKLALPSPLNLSIEKAESLLNQNRWQEAEQILREALDEAPEHPEALFGLARALLARGEAYEALYILKSFPASPLYTKAQILRPLGDALVALREDTLPDETDLDAAYRNSIRLASRGKFLAALDGLLEILRQDKRYRGDKARQAFVAILEVMGDESQDTKQYRSELTATLF